MPMLSSDLWFDNISHRPCPILQYSRVYLIDLARFLVQAGGSTWTGCQCTHWRSWRRRWANPHGTPSSKPPSRVSPDRRRSIDSPMISSSSWSRSFHQGECCVAHLPSGGVKLAISIGVSPSDRASRTKSPNVRFPCAHHTVPGRACDGVLSEYDEGVAPPTA